MGGVRRAPAWILAIGLVAVGSLVVIRGGPGAGTTTPVGERDGPPATVEVPVDPTARADLLYGRGLTAAQEGSLEEALAHILAALEADPGRAEIHDAAATVLGGLDRVSDALRSATRAVEHAPGEAIYLSNRAQLYRRFGNVERALADLDLALEIAPDLVAARFNRGSIYYALGRHREALEDFSHCVRVEPSTMPPYFNRAATYEALGRIDEAKADLETFIERSGNERWVDLAQETLERLREEGR